MGWIASFQKAILKSWAPVAQDVALNGNRVLADVMS